MYRITDFVDSFIPENLSKKRGDALKEELTCHILDKKDYYRELGYDENVSIEKAIADFGDSEEINRYVYNEFKELYSRGSNFETIDDTFAAAAFLIIAAMNYLCYPLDTFVWSFDSNRDPFPAGAFISFCMIFVVLMMISIARIKEYRKTLISIGITNTLIACSFFFCLYPQMAAWTMNDHIIYLSDRFTPISVWGTEYLSLVWFHVLWLGFPLIPALYSFIAAVRIIRGTAKPILRPAKKVAVFAVFFLVFALVSSLLQPVSSKYIENSSSWFAFYKSNISDETQQIFDEIQIGDAYCDVSDRLKEKGYLTIDSYKNSFDRATKMQFEQTVKSFEFVKDYEMWFNPEEVSYGNSFLVGLRQENGVISAKGIGNMGRNMYTKIYNDIDFGREGLREAYDLQAVIESFRKLKKGDFEAEVMSRFGKELGEIYTRRLSVEDGKEISYYRLYCCEELNQEGSDEGYSCTVESRYIELTFENGKLIKGAMYDEVTSEKTPTVTIEELK